MLTCMACSKQQQVLKGGGGRSSLQQLPDEEEVASAAATPTTKQQSIKALTAQIKDIALKASGAYKHCKPCSGASSHHHNNNYAESDASDRLRGTSPRLRLWGKEMEARLKGISSGEATPTASSISSTSIRLPPSSSLPLIQEPEEETKEWVAQVEPGVLITFLSLPRGAGNDLKRIRFSREMFNKWQAQKWWAENYDKVMELYNVQRFNQQAVPLPNPLRSEDESSKIESAEDSPMTPPLSKERLPRNFHRPLGMGYSSSESLEHHPVQPRHYYDATPKLSSISGAKTETSSMDASIRTSSSREADRSGEFSVSNASDMETEWVEEDEPGVYITIRALPGNIRELRRVRFSRERFGEMHARLWWEENRARIHEQYL